MGFLYYFPPSLPSECRTADRDPSSSHSSHRACRPSFLLSLVCRMTDLLLPGVSQTRVVSKRAVLVVRYHQQRATSLHLWFWETEVHSNIAVNEILIRQISWSIMVMKCIIRQVRYCSFITSHVSHVTKIIIHLVRSVQAFQINSKNTF